MRKRGEFFATGGQLFAGEPLREMILGLGATGFVSAKPNLVSP